MCISHASDDAELTAQVYRQLRDDGHEAFLNHDLRDCIAVGDQ
ncbi:MAG: hypothetical protein ACR2GH_08085 [Pseudonocardia sp.]